MVPPPLPVFMTTSCILPNCFWPPNERTPFLPSSNLEKQSLSLSLNRIIMEMRVKTESGGEIVFFCPPNINASLSCHIAGIIGTRDINLDICAAAGSYSKGLPYMTSAEKGGFKKFSKFANKQYILCGQRRGRGSKNPKTLWLSYMEAP